MTGAAHRLRDLVAVNRAIVSTLDYNEVLRQVVDRARDLTGADACALLLVDAERRVRVVASRGIPPEKAEAVDAPLNERLNTTLCQLLGYNSADYFLGVPVIYQGNIEGLLAIYRRAPAAPEPDEELLVGALADQAAIAIEHARRFGELADISAHQQRLLETIQSNTTTALAYLDHGLRFVEANAAYCAVLRASREELIGRAHGEVFSGTALRPILERVRDRGEPAELREVQVMAADLAADRIWWDWSARPIRGRDGAIDALVLSAVDVSEKVRARLELEAAARRKDEFLAMLAHELRNPLAAIHTAVELWREAGPRDERMCGRAREAAGRQVAHMTRLLDDLLDVSRITHGKISLEREVLDLGKVVEQAAESVMSLVRAKEHELSLSAPSEPVWVIGDLHRLVQIVSNLLTNASKYSESGGRIELEVGCRDGTAEVRVRDRGLGIPPEALDQVFELFVQSERPLERENGGLGIGLTVVKRLVEMHGGTVSAFSEGPGRGSEFVVRLPALSRPT